VRLAFLSVLFESAALPEQYPLERFVREWTKRDEEAFARSLLRGRWLNALQRTGVSTVGEVGAMSERRLLEIPQIGPKAVADISAALRDPRACSDDSIELLGVPQARCRLRARRRACADAATRYVDPGHRPAVRDLA
jgi:hypothetical protein